MVQVQRFFLHYCLMEIMLLWNERITTRSGYFIFGFGQYIMHNNHFKCIFSFVGNIPNKSCSFEILPFLLHVCFWLVVLIWILISGIILLSLPLKHQGSQKHYKGISDCVRTIVKEEGTHALFKVWPFLEI